MPVHFDSSRMAEVIDNHEKWWCGELNRPLLHGVVSGAYPAPRTASAPLLSQANCHDFSISPEEIIDRIDCELSRNEYLGDGYPMLNMDCFGPGVLAAFCGAGVDNSSGRIWFFPCEENLSRLHVRYDPENAWSRRIKAIYRAGLDRWNGSVIMGLPDLGGVLDVLASLCGTENLLYALIDEPEEVQRLISEIEAAWYAAYHDFAQTLAPQGVFTDWNGLLSRKPAYIIQCDFSYMIGPEAFRTFVLDTLLRDTQRLEHTIYHLDGVGELPHLDMLLALPQLNAVQWVHGDGKPGPLHWMDVYRRIANAGKQIMIVGNALENGFEELTKQLHITPFGSMWLTPGEKDAAIRLLNCR